MARLDLDIGVNGVAKVTDLTKKISILESEQTKLKQNNIDTNKTILALDKSSENYAERKATLTKRIKENSLSLKQNSLSLKEQKNSHKQVVSEIKIHESSLKQLAREQRTSAIAAIKAQKEMEISAKKLAIATSTAYEDSERDIREAIEETSIRVEESNNLRQRELKETKRQQEITNNSTKESTAILRRQENQLKESAEASKKFRSTLKGIATGALAYIAIDRLITSTIDLGKAFIDTADDMTLVNSRLGLVTKSSEEFTNAQEQLFEVAQDARVELTTTIDLYSQMARSTSALNITQDRLLNVTSNISKALTISGGSADSANAAIFQLNQGFASGTLRGEELNSVMEQTPRLSQAIADGLGLTVGQLRAVASEGKLTTETVITALESQTVAIESEFGKIATTVEQSNLLIENSAKKAISSLNEQFEITKSIANAQTLFSIAATETFSILSEGFGESSDKAAWFAETTLTGMKWMITSAGELYDNLETVGDVFSFIGKSGEFAFYGLVSAASFVAGAIGKIFESAMNSIITMINTGISGINLLGADVAPIGKVDFSSQNLSNAKIAGERALKAGQDLEAIRLDFSNESTIGRTTAKTFTDQIDLAIQDMANKKTPSSFGSYVPTANTPAIQNFDNSQDEFNSIADALNQFGDTFSDEDLSNIAGEYSNNDSIQQQIAEMLLERNPTANDTLNFDDSIKVQEESMQDLMDKYLAVDDAIKDTTDATDDFVDTFYNDDDSVYEVLGEVTDTSLDLSDSLTDLTDDIETVTTAVETLSFQFSDTLFDSLQSNSDALSSIGKDTALSSISYNQALIEASNARDLLIHNTLDTGIGELYTDAYSQFISSASDYIGDASNFGSSREQAFARSTVGVQAGQLQEGADLGSQTLDSMNNLLAEINLAYEDDDVTEEEQLKLQKLALATGDANNALLLLGLKDVVGTVDNQTYYDNDSLAKSTDLRVEGGNTVTGVLGDLMGDGKKGISINGLYSGLTSLAVATNLDEDDLADIDKSTVGTITALNNIQTAIEETEGFSGTSSTTTTTTSSGTTAAEAKAERYAALIDEINSIGTYTNGVMVVTDAQEQERNAIWAKIASGNYAKGGYTGDGGKYDIAGTVHKGEVVFNQEDVAAHGGASTLEKIRKSRGTTPAWMTDTQAPIFNTSSKGFSQGGYTSTMKTSNNSNGELERVMHMILSEQQQLNATFNRVTTKGSAMQVELVG